MRGIVVLEGADASGKTTLADYLAREHEAVVMHQTFREHWLSDRFGPYYRHLARYRRAARLAGKGHLVVLDRAWLSNDVYSSTYRGGWDATAMHRVLYRLLARHGAAYVLCLPENVVENHRHMASKREEMYADISGVARRMAEVWQGNPDCPDPTWTGTITRHHPMRQWPEAITYDFENEGHNLAEVARRVSFALSAGRIMEVNAGRWLDDAHQNGLGSLQFGNRVLVGDGPSPRASALRWPFSLPSGCSLWLNEQLQARDVDERGLAWVNAHQLPDQLGELTRYCPDLRFVALGNEAGEALRGQFVSAVQVPHPQYVRRFHARQPVYLDGYFNTLLSG